MGPSGAPPKKSNAGLIIGIIIGVFVLLCGGGLLVGGLALSKNVFPFAGCVASMAVADEGIKGYVKETGKFPDADKWQDQAKKYIKSKEDTKGAPMKIWMGEGPIDCSIDGTEMSLYFNKGMAGQDAKKLQEQGMNPIVLLWGPKKEGINLSANANEFDKIPAPKLFGENIGWLKMSLNGSTNMEAGRHRGFKIDAKSDSNSDDKGSDKD